MSMSKGTSHYNRQVWEDGKFPILCQTCLGDNPYMRIMTEKFGAQCKVCNRPFTTFRWCPGVKMRYKKTEICQTCARAKNICQTCLLDLQYGLPVQVRDQLLASKLEIPKSDVNREYFSQNLDISVANSDPTQPFGALKAAPPSDVLAKLARNSPYYKRNRPHICSFWVKGECKRGDECPYRHEKPTDPEDPLSDQNIKDRYFGVNDPVAEKLLKRASEIPRPIPPEDKSITTIYVGNVGELIEEKDLRDYFYQYGEIRSITMIGRQNCAFIQYTTRQSAEVAVEKSYQKLIIHGQKLTIRWGKSQAKRAGFGDEESTVGKKSLQLAPVPGLPIGAPDYFGLAQNISGPSTSTISIPTLQPPIIGAPSLPTAIHYPSQDPNRMGSVGIKLPNFNKE